MNPHHWLQRVWYDKAAGGWLLMPLAWLFSVFVEIRRSLFRNGILRSVAVAAPVIVVGNITVGGTGKTPLVIWLARRLGDRGLRVGIVSRGHGSTAGNRVRYAHRDSDPKVVGDEPVLMARRCNAPVVVGVDRVKAAERAVRDGSEVIIADDGLQHYRLRRDFEIAVVDGQRRFGNGRLLPAGPLREPRGRVDEVDAVVINDGHPCEGEFVMHVDAEEAIRLDGNETVRLSEFSGQSVHAVAGIGNPARFFAVLRGHGIDMEEHPFPDHARLRRCDIVFTDDKPVLMTEKDAVKCSSLSLPRHWFVPVATSLDDMDSREILGRIEAAVSKRRHELA